MAILITRPSLILKILQFIIVNMFIYIILLCQDILVRYVLLADITIKLEIIG